MKSINEKRLFELLPFFFENPSSVLFELAQNASRANATRLDITLEGDVLEVRDDGSGVEDPEALLVLAGSEWPGKVMEEQVPAGWGLFFLYCLSEEVYIESRFGSISVDCRRYLKDAAYRENICDDIEVFLSGNPGGFYARAVLQPGMGEKLTAGYERKLCYFPLDITVNGKPVDKKSAESAISRDFVTRYEGNDVYVRLDEYAFRSPEALRDSLNVIWYGIPIESHRSLSPDVVIDVRKGTPLTPVLPYRREIKNDAKLERFLSFLRGEVAGRCIGYIEAPENTDDLKLIKRMKILTEIGTQVELDGLTRFYVTRHEPYYDCAPWDSARNDAVVRKGERVVSESVKVYERAGKRRKAVARGGDDMLFLPEGTVVSVDLPGRRPAWLAVEDKRFDVELVPGPKGEKEVGGYYGFTWRRLKEIRCGGKNIKVLAYGDSGDGIKVYYTDGPEDFREVSSSVFWRVFYNEDGDMADTQEYEYDREVEEQIMKLTERYRLEELFKGFHLAGINAGAVSSLRVEDTSLTVTLKDGAKKVLSIC